MLHIRKYKQIKGKKVIKYLAWNIGITKYEYRKIIIKENITGIIKNTFLVRILKLSENPWNKEKIIISVTSFGERIKKMEPVFESILNQDYPNLEIHFLKLEVFLPLLYYVK